ncbi:MAG: hypothetical protein AUI92_05310 [Thaumarchaeota archaeon 13_1_40CM_3_38_6]|nr:MAG: hypothetical protein AUI92_05310 [Thaumarchaeota archaeon 13_1_40CM_3_38_6]
MKTLIIHAPDHVAVKLASLRRYFILKVVPPNADGTCSIDLVFYGDLGQKFQKNICNFLPTELPKDIMTMFWFKFSAFFPRESYWPK